MNITRRETLKNISLSGILAFMPQSTLAFLEGDLPLHVIGIGGAGSNMVEQLHQKGFTGKFTCISEPARPHCPGISDLSNCASRQTFVPQRRTDV